MNPDSPAEIRALLDRAGLALKKRWGQNFLVNRGARERLIQILGPRPGETVWEIGPGLGSMTGLLAAVASRVFAFEVDRGLCRYLEETLQPLPNFTLVPGDFLETWKGVLSAQGTPERILGNLPYRSASLMIADIIESGAAPARAWSSPCRGSLPTAWRPRRARRATPRSRFSASPVSREGNGETSSRKLLPGARRGLFHRGDDTGSPGAPTGDVLRALSGLSRALFSSRRKTIRNNARDERRPWTRWPGREWTWASGPSRSRPRCSYDWPAGVQQPRLPGRRARRPTGSSAP